MGAFCDSNFVRLNFTGKTYTLRKSGILKYAERRPCPSLLEKFVGAYSHQERVALADDYLPGTDEYYFFRSADLFEPILDYHQTDELHVPKGSFKCYAII